MDIFRCPFFRYFMVSPLLHTLFPHEENFVWFHNSSLQKSFLHKSLQKCIKIYGYIYKDVHCDFIFNNEKLQSTLVSVQKRLVKKYDLVKCYSIQNALNVDLLTWKDAHDLLWSENTSCRINTCGISTLLFRQFKPERLVIESILSNLNFCSWLLKAVLSRGLPSLGRLGGEWGKIESFPHFVFIYIFTKFKWQVCIL